LLKDANNHLIGKKHLILLVIILLKGPGKTSKCPGKVLEKSLNFVPGKA
jgi:hypothetical protein